jgi:hypothetical protein
LIRREHRRQVARLRDLRAALQFAPVTCSEDESVVWRRTISHAAFE